MTEINCIKYLIPLYDNGNLKIVNAGPLEQPQSIELNAFGLLDLGKAKNRCKYENLKLFCLLKN